MPSRGLDHPSLTNIVETDLIARYSTVAPALLIQAIMALVCTAFVMISRTVVDLYWPGAGAFSLIFPAVLIATLFGRWQAGLMTWLLTFVWVWYYVFEPVHSFGFYSAADAHWAVVYGGSAGAVLIFAELFRRGVRRAVHQRDSEIAHHEVLLRELDHRTKNNFMIVTSLLQLQMRQLKSQESKDAFGAAVSRVHSIAAAHAFLYDHRDEISSDRIPAKTYLESLVTNVFAGLFSEDAVTLDISIDNMSIQRDQAIAIGLVLNEVMTNAAKHAFDPGQPGKISVEFRAGPANWTLIVSDNGKGVCEKIESSGLGTTLIQAFATKADAEVLTEALHPGTRVTVVGVVAS